MPEQPILLKWPSGSFLREIALRRRLQLLVVVFVIGFLLFGGAVRQTLEAIKVGGAVYQRVAKTQELVADVLPPRLYIVESYLVCLQIANASSADSVTALTQRLQQLRNEYQERRRHWAQEALDPDVANALLQQADKNVTPFFDTAFSQLLPAVTNHDVAGKRTALAKMDALYVEHREAIDRVNQLAKRHVQENETWANAAVQSKRYWLLAVLLLTLAPVALLAHRIRVSVTRPIGDAVTIAHRIAEGDLSPIARQPYRDEAGQLYSALADMADRLRTSLEALKKAHFMTEQALDIARAGTWHIDFQNSGDTVILSERARLILGEPPSTPQSNDGQAVALFENGCKDANDPDSWAALQQGFADAMSGANPNFDVVYAYKRALDAKVIWVHSLGRAVYDASGRVTDIFGMLQDVTAETQAHRALQEAKALAESATRMKSDFLANMSHEIRTPLNAIIGLTYLALKADITPKLRDYLRTIQTSGQHLMGVINDVLDFSKIEAGKLDLEEADFSLAEVLDGVVALVSHKAQEQGLQLQVEVGAGIPDALIGDALRLRQILLNYTNNAIKFTQHGEVRIAVALLEDAAQDVLLRFEVSDTGVGLHEDQIARLFQSFEQADASITRKHGGTGLGLAICKDLAERMKGEVGVHSEVGVGSTFWFTARLRLGSGTASARKSSSASPVLASETPPRHAAGDPAGPVPQSPTTAAWLAASQRLAELLADDDARACDQFSDNVALLEAAFPKVNPSALAGEPFSDFASLRKAVENFEFTTALSILQRAIAAAQFAMLAP